MPSLAPSPSSSSEDDQSDGSSKSPPTRSGSSRSSGSSSDENGDSSSPSPPSSDDDGGSDSQDSSSSTSKGSQSSRRSPPPSKSSPSPSKSPSRSSRDGGNSDDSSPSSSNESFGDSDDTDSSPPPPPPRRRPSPEDSEPSPSPSSSSSSSRSPPRRSSPTPPPRGSSDDSPPLEGSRSSPPSPSPPPPPANHSVVFIPVVNSHPGAPPGLVSIAPPGTVGVMSSNLPGAQGGAAAGMQAASSPGSTSSASAAAAAGADASSSSSQLHSAQAVNGQVAAAIAGASVAGLLFIMVAIFFIVTRRRRKMMEGMVYHSDGSRSYYMHSGQLMGSNHPSGMFYGPPPPGASGGFSYGPLATLGQSESFRGAGFYRSGSLEQQPGPGSNKSSFSYEELTSITSNFSRDNVIGEGGFGCVYKGWLADGKCVAVKQLKAGSGQGEREFQAEVEIISRVHHRHLVSLVGYCVAQHHRMLIYEFVPNGTLEHHLHGRGVPVMDWPTRLRIAIGAAKGLAYLHEDCHPRIIHRDIKTANILLDYSFEAQVADFGLAKLSNDTNTHVSTRIMGTFGYLAPEYASSGKLTDRSDVFSFGVVLLELITGRKPVDQDRPLGDESLVEWARPVLAAAINTGEHDELVDPRLEGRYNKAEMVRMVEAAAACVRHSAPKRPRMVQVMRALDVDVDEGSMSDLSNGVKVGQSRVFNNSQQEAALEQLRRTAFATEEFTGEFEPSREYGAADPALPVLASAIDTGEHDEMVDPRMEGRYNKAEMARMVEAATACVRHSALKRPRMV